MQHIIGNGMLCSSFPCAAAITDHFDVERAASIFEAMQDEAMPFSNKRTHTCVERSHIAHLVWKIFAVHVIGILNTPSYRYMVGMQL